MTTLTTADIYQRLWGYTKPDMTDTLDKIQDVDSPYFSLKHRVKIYKPCGKTYLLAPPSRPYETWRYAPYYDDLRRELNQIEENTVKYKFYKKGQEEEVKYSDMSNDWARREPMIYFALALPQEQKTFEQGMKRVDSRESVPIDNRIIVTERTVEIIKRTRCFITVKNTLKTWNEYPADTHRVGKWDEEERTNTFRCKIVVEPNGDHVESVIMRSYGITRPEWFKQGSEGK